MANQLTSAKLLLQNNFIEFIFTGECVALEMEISGDAILERQLDYTWNIMNNDKKVIIFNLNNNAMPSIIFKYTGNLKIGKCFCADSLGNKVEAFKVKGFVDTNKIKDMDSAISKMTDFYIKDLKTKSTQNIKFKKGLRIIPKRTFSEYKAKEFNDVTQLKPVTKKPIKPIKKIKGKTKGY